MTESEIQICVVSNSKRDRVKVFCKAYGMDCITHARKPFSKGIKECLARYTLPASVCALAGDQIYTDVLGANRAGIRVVLVEPIELAGNPGRYLRYGVEIPFRALSKKGRL